MQIRCSGCAELVEYADSGVAVITECPSCGTIVEPDDDFGGPPPRRPRTLSHFELLKQVGCGQFGDVWMARDRELGRIVAVKIPRIGEIDHETLALFLREARTAATLRHANIVQVHEVGRNDDLAYIVTDFISGDTLAARLKQHKPTPREAAILCGKLAGALQHAHERGVIHRDVKPGNIMIDGDGEPQLMDFGLAKRDGSESTIAVEGEILGTAAYMPPEQARGDACQADARSDVYSLGIILYEMLTGGRPFQGEMSLVLHKVLTREPPAPRTVDAGIPRDLETVCLKAITKDPDGRYQTADEMARDLRRFLNDQPVLASRVGAVEQFGRWMRRNRAITASLAIALLAVCVSAFSLIRRTTEENSDDPAIGDSRPATAPSAAADGIVRLTTNPPGAEVRFIRLSDATGEPDPTTIIKAPGVSPVQLKLDPGDYLVVAVHREGFHEVYRRVPRPGERSGSFPHISWRREADGLIVLPPINRLGPAALAESKGMSRIPGSKRFEMSSVEFEGAPKHLRRIPSFYLQPQEVTVRKMQNVIGQSWNGVGRCNTIRQRPADPVACVGWNLAVAFAELEMMRIPTEAEFELAASLRGSQKFPWGNDEQRFTRWRFGAAGEPKEDRVDVPGSRPVYGLYSNVAEWTTSWYVPYHGEQFHSGVHSREKRVVRGGPLSVAAGASVPTAGLLGPRERAGVFPMKVMPKLGFRCARSLRLRIRPEDFETVLPAK